MERTMIQNIPEMRQTITLLIQQGRYIDRQRPIDMLFNTYKMVKSVDNSTG